MNTILKSIVWVLLLPINLIRWLLKTLLWLIVLPFRIIDAIFKTPFWFFRWLYSLLHFSHTVPATILHMWQESHMADSNSYVLFDSRGEKIRIRLTMFEEKGFFSKHSEGDVGTLKHRGAWLVKWQPATVKKPFFSGSKSRVAFLSYAHEWKDDAKFVAKYLGSRGITVWFDEDRLKAGDSLNKRIINEIQKADFFIPMLSKDYCFSEWCTKELEVAIAAKCKILPIKVEGGELVMPPHISRIFMIDLGDVVFIDLTKKKAYSHLNQLIKTMST